MRWFWRMNRPESICVVCPSISQPSLEALCDTALNLAKVANPDCQVIGISVNTQHMSDDDAKAYLAKVEEDMGLPATDPFRYGAGKLVDALEAI